MEKLQKENKNRWSLKIAFIVISFLLATPSIMYLFQNKTILGFETYFDFLLKGGSKWVQSSLYLLLLVALIIVYLLIIKKRKKLFKNNKTMIGFIAIISLIFAIIVPFTSSDIFYYLGVGRLDSTYHQNPYYTTIQDFVQTDNHEQLLNQDGVLKQGYENYWSMATVVYGSMWTIICRVIAGCSLGNLDIAMLLFKLVNILVHLLSCYLIYKITKKKIFVLLYGLNPFILLEGISNVHNDIYIVLFVLASIYFLKKKNNIVLCLLFLALATAIKYFTILLLPFLILYYLRKEKTGKRTIKTIGFGFLFLIFLMIPYLFYIRDFEVFKGLLTQQDKIAKSLYVVILTTLENSAEIITFLQNGLLALFSISFIGICFKYLLKPEIKFRKIIQTVNWFIFIFLFLLITQFQPWYIMWLFPCIMWQKAKNIKLIIGVSLISQIANAIFLVYGEGWQYGTPYFLVMVAGIFSILILNHKNTINNRISK